jgi:signal transduction histidine kinase
MALKGLYYYMVILYDPRVRRRGKRRIPEKMSSIERNNLRRQSTLKKGAAVLLAVFILSESAAGSSVMSVRTSELDSYLYQYTKRLVRLVDEAADLMEKRGQAVFEEFGRKGSKWFNDKHYLFVYDISGTCLFHPVEPELVGKNLMSFKDMNGKPVIRMITDVGKKPGNRASGWVFYLWEDGTQISPLWKASYIRKVIGLDKKTYLVGSGLHNIKIEKEFVRERVDEAAELLVAKGKETAFEDFRDPASPFYFLDTYIFVLRMDGRSLVDPAYPTNAGRDLSRFRDVVGMYVVREMIKKLRNSESAWVQYMWPIPGAWLPSRKLAYVRKVKVGEEFLIVGAEYFLPTSIWMRE